MNRFTEIANKAIEILKQKGWNHKGGIGGTVDPNTGSVCMMQAIIEATEILQTEDTGLKSEYTMFDDEIYRDTGNYGVTFNDNVAKKFDDVKNLLLRIGKKLDAKEA